MPSAPLTLFRWSFPIEGVLYAPGAAGSEGALMAEGGGIARREYDPLARPPIEKGKPAPPRLFEALATAELSGEALAKLAGKWGLLWSPIPKNEKNDESYGPSIERDLWMPGFGVEPVADWINELRQLADAFRLLGAIELATRAPSSREARDAREALSEQVGGQGPFTGEAQELVDASPDDVLLLGKLTLRGMLDRKLDEHTKLRMIYDTGYRALRMRASPRSLLGAAWLQLAEEANTAASRGGDRNPLVRRCLCCSGWFVVKSGRRGHDRYCEPACRSNHQRRRTEARALAVDGRSARSIAATVNVPLWLVREWLGGGEETTGASGRRRKEKR